MADKSRILEVLQWIADLPGFIALAEWIKARVEKKIDYNPRDDVMWVISELQTDQNPTAQVAGDNIFGRLQVALSRHWPDIENNVVVSLGTIIPRENGKIKMDEAKRVFRWIAGMNDPQFEVLIAALKHDPVKQLFVYWVCEKGYEGAKQVFDFVFTVVKMGIADARQFVERKLSEFLGFQNIAEAVAYSRQREQALGADIAAQRQKGWWRRWWS